MTKITQMAKTKDQERAKPGPKPNPDALKVVKKTVSLQPSTFEYLAKRGKGVLSKGIEAAVAEKRGK